MNAIHLSVPGTSGESLNRSAAPFTSRAWHWEVNPVRLWMTPDEAAVAIVAVVETFGLQPVEAPPILRPITEDDLGVVCWMTALAAE